MLILTRRLGESIQIGDDIKISVLGIHGRQVRIGIDAPPNVIVHREEIYVKIQRENQKAAKSVKKDLRGVVNLLKDKLKGKENNRKPDEGSASVLDYRDDSTWVPGKKGKKPGPDFR